MIKECWFRIPVAGCFWYKIWTKTILLTSKPIAISNTRYQCQSRIWIDLLGVSGRNFGRGEIWVATLIRVEVASVKDTREEPWHSCLGHSPHPSPSLSTRFGWFARASGGGGGGGRDHKGGAGILALVPLLPFYLSATAQDHLSSKSVKRNSMCPQMKYNDKKIYCLIELQNWIFLP